MKLVRVVLSVFFFGIVANAQAGHGLDGITVSLVPDTVASYLEAKHYQNGSKVPKTLSDFVLTTLISNGSGYASIANRRNPIPKCAVWFESVDADGFAVFGIKDANRVYQNSNICKPFKVRKLSDGQLDIRWLNEKGVGKVLRSAPLQPINWQAFPLQKLTAGGLSLGPITAKVEDTRRGGGRGLPVYVACKSCNNTLMRHLAVSLENNKQYRLSGDFVSGESLLGGYKGEAVSSYTYRHNYLSGAVELTDFIPAMEKRYGKPSLVLNDAYLETKSEKRPEVLIWGYGLDGQQLSSEETNQQCNPTEQDMRKDLKYDTRKDQSVWACGMIFSISIDYKSIKKPYWVSKYVVQSYSPSSIFHHHFTDRLTRVLEARERYIQAKKAKP